MSLTGVTLNKQTNKARVWLPNYCLRKDYTAQTCLSYNVSQILVSRDFPGGTVARNPPCNAGDYGSIPGLGKVHMLQSSYAPVPQLLRPHLEPVLPSKRSHCNEKPEYHNEEEPLAHRNLRKPEHSNKDSAWPKIK